MSAELRSLMSEAKIQILRLLLLHPEQSFYQREIAERTGLRVRAVQQALKPLVAAGIVLRTRRGSQVFYRVNRECSIVPELTGMIVKTVGIAEPLRDALETVANGVKMALLFGSFASGEFRAESDVDLLVIGSASPRTVVSALAETAVRIGREINPVVMSAMEFIERVETGDRFVSGVLAGPKTYIIGGPDELEELAGGGPGRESTDFTG